ncbi:uncharacterized protein LOC111258975 isoform X2 [Varroa jacobsoni]|uniref:ZP domain-containing protein n=1 Tax=Varroa destructor TaxID=109461 RepID=A0A7M7JZG0_VARDE|nr:uncharacterized protein LOC111249523 isoform X2 [Varroa destructor]XP_022686337.1 uncharacterized protein LOC111258975 isoform X2 [Varroa jacobsoni]
MDGLWAAFLLGLCALQVALGQDDEFSPSVSAVCDKGYITISVATDKPFQGVVHTRDVNERGITKELRKEPCVAYGQGGTNTSLRLSLFSRSDDPLYCGVRKREFSEERYVAVYVRAHKSLELQEDKSYIISCGKGNFRNARNELNRVTLNFIEDGKKVPELIVGRKYQIRATVSGPGRVSGIRVRSCFAFSANHSDVEFIDRKGCSIANFVESFKFVEDKDYAEAELNAKFKFPESNKIHVQCDVFVCSGENECPENSCQPRETVTTKGAAGKGREAESSLSASTSVFVVEPGQASIASPLRECTEWRFPWLIGLCIALAILLLIMLIVNIFLCSSLTCSCVNTEVEEKESSEIEDYDPYKGGSYYPASHYGSHTTLHKQQPQQSAYGVNTLGGRSHISNASDHYTTVHSRPHSRYSQRSSKDPHRSHYGMSNGGYH